MSSPRASELQRVTRFLGPAAAIAFPFGDGGPIVMGLLVFLFLLAAVVVGVLLTPLDRERPR